MQRVKLIHWKAKEIKGRARILRALGYEPDSNLEARSQVFRQIGDNPPAAVIIDLSRSPLQRRGFGLMIHKRKSTRHIPLVFVRGAQ